MKMTNFDSDVIKHILRDLHKDKVSYSKTLELLIDECNKHAKEALEAVRDKIKDYKSRVTHSEDIFIYEECEGFINTQIETLK